jgi:poly [ADP-ribose] polymerase
MFGKGVYFADLCSKSANYCHASKQNPTGILLLCEVALGSMYLKREAEMISKLNPKYQSCKGEGAYEPDPKSSQTL